jgi:hypothetical protein
MVFFFFAKFDIARRGPRTAFGVLTIMVAVYYGTIAIIAAVTLVKHFVIRLLSRAPRSDANLRFWEKLREKVKDKRGTKLLFYGVRAFNLFWIFWCAVCLEVTLNDNHVTGTTGGAALSGTGQQLPTIMGAVSFLRMLLLMFRMWREGKKRTASDLGPGQDEEHTYHPVNLQESPDKSQ